ncbi:MAG: efflux transporter outer membrane subunit [Thiotrichales bacterium]|jgi:multidrug efflux system outer membrane protein|nr:efflux transporter outer membrane subunit [Thiotrichales bacterium]
MYNRKLSTASMLLSVAVASFLVAGCAPMSEPGLAKVDESLIPVSNKMAQPLPDWQTFFADKRLQALLTTALDNNRDLRIAIARVAETRAQYGIARADRFPEVDLGVGATRSSTPGRVSPSGNRYDLTSGNMSLSLPSYELDLWGRVANLSEAALATFLATEANAKAVRLSLIGDIASTYYQALEAQSRLVLLNATKENRAAFLALVDNRVQVGLATQADKLQAQAVVDGLVRDIADLQRQQTLADNALSVLVGVPVTKLALPASLPLQQQADSEALKTDLPSTHLLQRPDVQAAELRLKASDANIEAARAAFLPRISLTASYGTASNDLNGLFANNSESWSFVPQITLPLFNAGRTQANLDVAAARQVVAVADYEKTLQNAFKDVADALSNRSSYRIQLTSQQAVLASQQQRLQISEQRYQQGAASYMEVLDAQRELQTAEQQLVQLTRALKVADVQVFKALGGGA